MWDDIADRDIAEKTFLDALDHLFDSALVQRLETLIARSRTEGLSAEEREEVRAITEARRKR
jgi:DNA primase